MFVSYLTCFGHVLGLFYDYTYLLCLVYYVLYFLHVCHILIWLYLFQPIDNVSFLICTPISHLV